MIYTKTKRFSSQESIPVAFIEEDKLTDTEYIKDTLKLVFIKSGTGIFNFADKKLSVLAPAILCINVQEKISLQEGLALETEIICFLPQYVNAALTFEKICGIENEPLVTNRQDIFLFKPFIERNEKYSGVVTLDNSTYTKSLYLVNSMKSEIKEQGHRHWSCSARSYFLELLFTLARMYDSPEEKGESQLSASSELADKVILHLNSKYAEKITVEELCHIYNTNKTTLQQQFRKATGQTVMNYLIALRVRLAGTMLRNTSLTVEEIAERTGFSDSTHLNKLMKKITGFSPKQYRKQDVGKK